jgi:hypothetical protein
MSLSIPFVIRGFVAGFNRNAILALWYNSALSRFPHHTTLARPYVHLMARKITRILKNTFSDLPIELRTSLFSAFALFHQRTRPQHIERHRLTGS